MTASACESDIIVADLPTVERFFLWAIRTWAAHHDDVSPIWWSLDRAFAQERIDAALIPFDRLMSALFAGLKRWPDIRCVRCPSLGTQEAQLLGAFAQLQQNNQIGARLALQDWLQPAAARAVCDYVGECTRALAAADLRFAAANAQLQQAASGTRHLPSDLH